jgi:hypothetical protein
MIHGREANTRGEESQRIFYTRSSEARRESFCPLGKDLSWKSAPEYCQARRQQLQFRVFRLGLHQARIDMPILLFQFKQGRIFALTQMPRAFDLSELWDGSTCRPGN